MTMITSSKLDRTITFQRKAPRAERGQAGQDIWVPVATVAASVQDVLPSRGETVTEGLSIQKRPARIRCYFRTDITGDMRIIFGARVMQIIAGPVELGHREGLEMMAQDYSTQGGAA